ncbi:MAG: trypsin-like peptidase domain-containing protein [Anaerolineae bacterium]
MTNRAISGWLFAIIFLGILVGIVGGGVMGALAGYYVVTTRTPVVAAIPIATATLTSAIPTQASSPASSGQTNLTLTSDSAIIDAVKKVEPAVVTVINKLQAQSSPFSQISPMASGSGVIIDQQGHIITNNHVVEGARELDVIYTDGTMAQARLVGADPISDLAVIQVDKVPAFAPLGDSNALQLGETVIAIGSPLGNYRGSVTVGVISGLNRSVQGTQQEGLIQTDAAINHGNSGGPLINLLGQVVGINTLVVRDTTSGDVAEGLGFSIPSEIVRDVSQQLIVGGKVEYPFIGISYDQITPQTAGEFNLPSRYGLLISQVTPGSPAAQVGLHTHDIILSIDGKNIDETHPLHSILFKYKVGDKIKLQVMRGAQTFTVDIVLVARPN